MLRRKEQDMQSDGDAKLKQAALLIAVLAGFLTPFMVSSINLALPDIDGEFGMGAVLLSWVPASYLLSAAVFLVPLGRLADIHGRKRIFSFGISIFTLSSFLIIFSRSAAVFLAFRALQGFGSAMIFGTSMAILTEFFPLQERGRVLGWNVAAIYLGLSLGPSLGGILTQQYGWRSIFLVTVPLGLLVSYLVATRLRREWADAKGEAFDGAGAVLYGLALTSLMAGLSRLPSRAGVIGTIGGVGGAVLFVLWERTVKSPLLHMGLFFRNPAFAFSNLAALINYSATFAVTFLMSLYLQYLRDLSPFQTGMVLLAQPVVMSVFSPLAGRLSDRIEPRIVASAGMAFTAAGLLLFTGLDRETAMGTIIAGLLLLGFGFALFSSPNTNAVMSSLEKRFYGVGSATLGTMRLVGQMLSMGIAIVLFALHIGTARIVPELYPQFLVSVRAGFIIFSALCVGGIFASLARGNVHGTTS